MDRQSLQVIVLSATGIAAPTQPTGVTHQSFCASRLSLLDASQAQLRERGGGAPVEGPTSAAYAPTLVERVESEGQRLD
jgi:hypothetical protein